MLVVSKEIVVRNELCMGVLFACVSLWCGAEWLEVLKAIGSSICRLPILLCVVALHICVHGYLGPT